jgi:thymidylate synthase
MTDINLTPEEMKLIRRNREVSQHEEYQYLHVIEDILEKGYTQDDRTGVGTLTQHGCMMRFNLRNNTLPVITTRRTFIRGAFEEFQWMLRGESDIKYLQDKNIHIWDGNTTEEFITNRGLKGIVPTNNIGTLYGYQIRNWGGDWNEYLLNDNWTGIDQLEKLIYGLKNDPNGRRHIISNYNVSQLNTGVLEPCHTLYGFNVDVKNREIHSTLFMRSVDVCCGLCLNIIHISMFTHMLAKLLGYNAGDFVFMGNNTHVYKSHIEQAKQQIKRTPLPFPTVQFKNDIKNLNDLINMQWDDVIINNYQHQGAMKYEMAI